MAKKVLIISYYWPPAGGPGVQRWLKFVKYLPDYDIDPIVYVPENPSYPIIDNSFLSEVAHVTTIKLPIKEPYQLAGIFSKKKSKNISAGIIPKAKNQSLVEKLMLFVRGNFFIPDARVFWVKPSVEYLTKYLQENPVEAIITTGPPHSLHLIGKQLQADLGVKWIADFRDPWTNIVYHKELKLTPWANKKHLALEQKVLQKADHIIVTSPTTKTEFEAITSKPITVITNGYDVEQVEKKPLDEKFTIAHIGSFLSERNPRILWKAIKDLTKENPSFKADLQIKLAGVVSQEVKAAITEFKLEAYVTDLGYLSHHNSVMEQRTAQVLLLIESNSEETRSILPGKLYEYMVSGRPVLAFGHELSDIKGIVTRTNCGVFCDYSDLEKVKQTLLEYYQSYKEGNLKAHPIGLQEFSRKNLTQKLASII